MLAVVLACTGTLVKLVEVGPIYAVVDGPGLAVYLLVNNVKLIGVHGVSCGGAVEMYGGGGLEVLLDSFPQGSTRFPYVGTGAVDVWALVLVDDHCLIGFGVLGVAQNS